MTLNVLSLIKQKFNIVICEECQISRNLPYYQGQFSKSIANIPIGFIDKVIGKKSGELENNYNWDIVFFFDERFQGFHIARNLASPIPLYYAVMEGTLFLSTDINALLKKAKKNFKPDPIWMTDYLLRSHIDSTYTFFREIKRLPPGHILTFDKENISTRQFLTYQPPIEISYKDKTDYVENLAVIFKESVSAQIKDKHLIGAELSGGLDCTGIIGVTKQIIQDGFPRKLFTYSHAQEKGVGFQKLNDERRLIEETLHLLRLDRNKHRYVSSKNTGIKPLLQKAFRIGNGVPATHYSIYSQYIYQLAHKDGVKILLSGWGGDHCISHRHTQKTFSKKRSNNNYITIRKLANLIFKKKKMPLHERTQFKLILKRAKEIFPELKEVDIQERIKLIQESRSGFSDFKEKLVNNVQSNSVIQRMEATYHITKPLGLSYRYPMLHPRLVEFFLSLPYDIILHPTEPRYMFKKMINTWLPKIISDRKKSNLSMYGWITDAYYFDYINNIRYSNECETYEQYFYTEIEKLRDEYEYQLFSK